MSKDTNDDPQAFDNWVQKLQKQSWELELLVTGFSIFLLLQVPDTIGRYANEILSLSTSILAGIPVFCWGLPACRPKSLPLT